MKRFKDAYRIALGTTYYYDDNWTFRTGIASMTALSGTSAKPFYLSFRPDRFWLSAGTISTPLTKMRLSTLASLICMVRA